MKKGETPQLSEQWWVKARPMRPLFSDPGLDKKLKAYEVAEDLFDYDKMLAALKEVRDMAATTIGACNKTVHADTIEALKKYPSVIAKKEDEVKKRQASAKKAASDGKGAAPPQRIGGPVVVWGRDVGAEVKKKYPAPWLNITGYKVELALNKDILDVLENEGDYATPAFMVQDAQEMCQKVVDEIVKKARSAEPLLAKDPKAVAPDMSKEVKTLVTNLGAQIQKIPQTRWNKFVSQKKQYKDYKIQSVQKVALGTLGVAGSAAAIAAAVPTGGASLALGIVGAVRSTAALMRTCADLWKEAETVQNGLLSDMDKLKKAYIDGKGQAKITVGAQEMSMTALKAFLGTHPPFVASLPKCDDDYKLWDNKVAHLTVNNREVAKEAVSLLNKTQQLEKVMASAKGNEAGKILDKIRKLRKVVNDGLDKASDLGGRVSNAEKVGPQLKQALDMLKGANPKYAEIFDKIFPTVVNLSLSAGNAGVGFKAATSALDYYSTAQGLANDILSEIKGKLEG